MRLPFRRPAGRTGVSIVLLLMGLAFPLMATEASILKGAASMSGGQPDFMVGEKPFRLPFDMPPGPDTWLLAQAYGNTTGAQRQRGQGVKAGQVVALSGDPAETCYGRPHLHFEIRDLRHVRKYNPVLLVQADWDNLALLGPFSRAFERDLDAPRKWQQLDDQPEAVSGGPLLNDFARPWPPDFARR